MTSTRSLLVGALAAVSALLLSGCSASTSAAPTDLGPADTLRLGYLANVTHAPALVALDRGFLADALGETELATEVFAAGPAAIEAISAGAIDAAYIGPSPAVNSFIRSQGESAVIVSGATIGGAALVVRDGIDSAADVRGAVLATPQLGNTQDVALRSWLDDQGLESSPTGGGDVSILPSENSDTLALFRAGELDGAWLPEPWASRLVLEADAHVLVDEATLWPDGAFPTTVLLVNKSFLAEHPDTVTELVEANVRAVDWLNANPDAAAAVINDHIATATGAPLAEDVLARALEHVTFSVDPVASSFPTLAEHAVDAGVGAEGELDGLVDLAILNRILAATGAAPVSATGLDGE
jgi:aliphatic sulfonates family ABC transporter substrate-binding protein